MVREEGAGSGPVVVLVHGVGMSGRYFAPLRAVLAHSARVLTVDMPGFGDAAAPTARGTALSVPELAGSVCTALTALGVRGATLVGHSMGAQVVAHVLRAAPQLAAAAVLVGPTVDDRSRSARRQGLRLAWDTVREPPGLAALLGWEYARCGPRRYSATVAHMLDDRIEEVLPSAQVPVLVLRGARDAIAPREWAERLAGAARHGSVAEVPGARHCAQWTHPHEVAAACRALSRS